MASDDRNETFDNLTAVDSFTDPGGTVHTGAIGGDGSGGSYTDEQAQDAVGTMADATLAYTDATPALGVADGGLSATHLSFDPVTQSELTTHTGTADAHHTKYALGDDVAASGTATLTDGAAVVATGITTTGTHIDVLLDPSGGGANAVDVKVAARAFWDTTAGEYKVEILEDGTSVGNPDVGWEVVAH